MYLLGDVTFAIHSLLFQLPAASLPREQKERHPVTVSNSDSEEWLFDDDERERRRLSFVALSFLRKRDRKVHYQKAIQIRSLSSVKILPTDDSINPAN